MKRIYLKPEVFTVNCMQEGIMLTPSESTRNVGGGPTSKDNTNDKPLTPGVNEWTEEDQDPYGGKGQGTGGAGSRSKSGMIWDEW